MVIDDYCLVFVSKVMRHSVLTKFALFANKRENCTVSEQTGMYEYVFLYCPKQSCTTLKQFIES